MTGGNKGLHGVTRGDRGLQGVIGGYKGLQEVTTGNRLLKGVTRGYRGLQRIRNFFLTKTFPETFSWSILHNNQS